MATSTTLERLIINDQLAQSGSYNNSSSGLTATTISDAIDEVTSRTKKKLTADTTLFVDTTLGTDAVGAGLTSGAGAYKTLEYAFADAANLYDLDDFKLIFQLADGTYTEVGVIFLPSFFSQTAQFISGAQVLVQGNNANPSAVVITHSGTPSRMFDTNEINVAFGLKDLTLTSTNASTSLLWAIDSDVFIDNIRVEGTFNRAFVLLKTSNLQQVGGSTLFIGTCNTEYLITVEEASRLDLRQTIEIETGETVTLSEAFIRSQSGSRVLSGGTITNNGTVTGKRFELDNGSIERDDDDLNYYPGTIAGTFEGICSYGSFNSVNYDNTTSGLTAVKVEEAVDEITDLIGLQERHEVNRETITVNKTLLVNENIWQHIICNTAALNVDLPASPINGTHFKIKNADSSTQSFTTNSTVIAPGSFYEVKYDGTEWVEW